MGQISQDFVNIVSPTLPRIRYARVGIIFGNISPKIISNMARHMAQLYQTGAVKKIIVTGGKKFSCRPETEAEYARKILLSQGVHGQHILFENKSNNSYENVKNARSALLKDEGHIHHEPILCLGRGYAARRFLMTMAKNWPEATPSFIGFDLFPTPKDQWHTCPKVTECLQNDLKKWNEYTDKGHIEPVNTKHLAWKIHKANKPKKLPR